MKKTITTLLGLYINTLAYVNPRAAGRRGFQLFCRPFRSPITDKQKQFFDSAHQFVIERDGHQVQAYRWGNGAKKILFLHGWQSHTYRWKTYIDALPKDAYTVYAIDAPGHGMSGGNFLSVPVYATFIEAMVQHIGGAHTVVGHSLGSFSLLYALYRQPNLETGNVILMAPPGEATDFMTFYRDVLRLSPRAMTNIYAHFKDTYTVTPDFFSTARFAATVERKGLIIHDEGDAEAPYHYAVKINEAWKQSQLLSTQGLGHNLKSLTVVEAVGKFIEEAGELTPA